MDSNLFAITNWNSVIDSRAVKFSVGLFFVLVVGSGTSIHAAPRFSDSKEPTVDQLCDSFYASLVENSSYEDAKQIAQEIYRIGKKRNDKNLKIRGLVRLAYVEIYFGKWRNHWEKKIERCEELLGNSPAIHNVAKAEFLMFTGHIKGKWQSDQPGGFKKIEESIWMANELGEDKLLVRATIAGAEILGYQHMDRRMLEYSYRALKIAEYTGHRSTIIAALNRLVFSLIDVGRFETAVPYSNKLLMYWPTSEVAFWNLELAGRKINFESRTLERINELKQRKGRCLARSSRIGQLYQRLAFAASNSGERQKSSKYYLLASKYHAMANASRPELETGFTGSILSIEESNTSKDIDDLIAACPNKNLTQNSAPTVTAISQAYYRVKNYEKAMEYATRLNDVFQHFNEDSWTQTEYAADDYLNAYLNSKYQTQLIDEHTRKSQFAIWALTFLGVTGLVSIAVGITRYRVGRDQRVKLEQLVTERTTALQEAIENAKMADEAKSEFVARVNHEIRNPLTSILAYCELLSGNTQDLSPQNAEFVSGIQTSSSHLLELVNGVLDVSQIEKGEIASQVVEFDLQETVAGVRQMLGENAAENGLEFECRLENPCDHMLIGDETKLRQIMINLVSNSIKFTNDGSVKLDVTLGSPRTDGDISVKINVVDTGCGIPKDEQKEVFEQFTRASANTTQPGNGLGLHITKRLVEHMGGRIWLTSQVGTGTKVQIILPFKIGKSLPICKPSPAPVTTIDDVRILIVDDQEPIRKTLGMQLEACGYSSRCCSTLDATISLIEFWQPQLVMLDLRMPDKDGYEILEKIQQTCTPHPVIVAMTGDATDTVREKCIHSGFDYFLTKPFRIQEVQKIVENEIIISDNADSPQTGRLKTHQPTRNTE